MRRHRRSRRKASLTERARCYLLPWRHCIAGCRAGLPPRSFSLDHWWEVRFLQRRVGCEPDKPGPPLARRTNDRRDKAVHRHPGRFSALAVLPTANPRAAADELERAVTKLGFKGAMVNGMTGIRGTASRVRL